MPTRWLQTQYQESLEHLLKDIFPKYNILANTQRKESTYTSHQFFEVDVEIPGLNLCFEFQDFYHYKSTWFSQTPLDIIQQRDEIKRLRLLGDAQTLIDIPCWWTGDTTSLQATIQFQRPDLELVRNKQEITHNPPLNFYEDHSQLMLASFPNSNIPNVMEHAWWIGEKWDGIRCYWDAQDKQLLSRNNVAIDLPHQADDLFGDLRLDAELWCGKGFFGESQAIMATFMERLSISLARLICFDEASFNTTQQPFETRYALVLSHLTPSHPMIINAPRFMCATEEVLQDTLQSITFNGGEGLMLRKPLSRYLPGRSESLFKIKSMHMHSDQEALVVKSENDGSLLLQLPTGLTFSVERDKCILHRQAVRGDVVTLRVDLSNPLGYRPFQQTVSQEDLMDSLSSVEVYRIRSDLSWEEVLQNDNSFPVGKLINRNLISNDEQASTNSSVARRSWKISERRAFFDKFANAKGMDPLNPVFWYRATPAELVKYDKGYTTITSVYGTKLSTVLMQVYPDIGLQQSQFKQYVQSQTKDFLDKFASSKGADPLSSVFWYNVSPSDLMRYDKGYKSIISKYGGKLSSILKQIYTDIDFQPAHSKVQLRKHEKARAFFNAFATARGTDPLNPNFWYKVTPSEIMRSNKGYGYRIISTYGETLPAILMKVYPDIEFQPSQFKAVSQSWKDKKSRKWFFDGFATTKGADPLVSSFWHNVTPQELKQYNKGYATIAAHYGGKLWKILMQIYPNIGLEQKLFKGITTFLALSTTARITAARTKNHKDHQNHKNYKNCKNHKHHKNHKNCKNHKDHKANN